jgi:hypothetical protein
VRVEGAWLDCQVWLGLLFVGLLGFYIRHAYHRTAVTAHGVALFLFVIALRGVGVAR